jgi:hypothetical protein
LTKPRRRERRRPSSSERRRDANSFVKNFRERTASVRSSLGDEKDFHRALFPLDLFEFDHQVVVNVQRPPYHQQSIKADSCACFIAPRTSVNGSFVSLS